MFQCLLAIDIVKQFDCADSIFQENSQKGLNVLTTCVFIVGTIAGSGFLTLPKAMDDAGKARAF